MKWHRAMTEIAGTEIKAKMIIMKKVGEKENYNPLRVLREMGVTLGFFFFLYYMGWKYKPCYLKSKECPLNMVDLGTHNGRHLAYMPICLSTNQPPLI